MNCPACSRELEQLVTSDIVVDVCRDGCGGIWFDPFELRKFDEPHEEDGGELLSVRSDTASTIDPSARLSCPKCVDTVMMRHYFSVERHVEVDECPACAGFWLDVGELREVRALFPSESARREAAAKYFDDVFGDRLDAVRAESAEKLAKGHQIANMFRFIYPSYYIPGKQDWGAF